MPVIAIGECMLELVRVGDGWQLNHAGDAFNTALNMRRLGVPVAFLSALGADPFSVEMRAAWLREQIDTSMVLTDPTRLPGLYAIRTDVDGERSFYYWRERSAVRRLFELPGIEAAIARACDARAAVPVGYYAVVVPGIRARPTGGHRPRGARRAADMSCSIPTIAWLAGLSSTSRARVRGLRPGGGDCAADFRRRELAVWRCHG